MPYTLWVMIKRYRYRLYPDADQAQFLARSFGCARVVFNDALTARQETFGAGEKAPSSSELMKAMAASKQTPERAWLAEVSDVPLQHPFATWTRPTGTSSPRSKVLGRGGRSGRRGSSPNGMPPSPCASPERT